MTLTKTQATSDNRVTWNRLSGTKEEVLSALSDEGIYPNQIAFYDDDGTNAIAVVCPSGR